MRGHSQSWLEAFIAGWQISALRYIKGLYMAITLRELRVTKAFLIVLFATSIS